jgi:hypothetical protein
MLVLDCSLVMAGTSGGAAPLLGQSGSGAGLTRGDYVSSAAGLDTYYSYFIEVPPGTARLFIDIFDINLGGQHDQIVTNTTTTRYQVLDPTGFGALTFALPPGVGPDNQWTNIVNAANPLPGHWELRIDTSSAVTAGSDGQGYGVRAHDGFAGVGGRELNVYAGSFINPAQLASSATSGRYHPYVTSGCTAQSNDFDWDASPTPGYIYASLDPNPTTPPPARFTTGPLPVSVATGTWSSQSFGPWSTDESSQDYGIWSLNYRLQGPATGDLAGNNAVLYVGNSNAATAPPVSQPEPNTFRIYFPTDAGGPPIKPQIGQGIIAIVSGADPPAGNQTTVFRVGVAVNNPTPYPISFAAPNELVRVEIPSVTGNRLDYLGQASVTQGGIVSQPAVNGTGALTWDPGVIPAGGTAQLEYNLGIRPQPSSARTIVTGTPASNGTTATYVDETCSGAGCSGQQLARATQTLGPLCELAVNIGVSLATRAVIGDLQAYASDRGVVVEWTTLAEHATVGFHLLRFDAHSGEYVRVNDRLLPGLLHSRHGGTYRYVDPQAQVSELHSYRLVEIEADGSRRTYGPYSVIVADKPRRGHVGSGSDRDSPVVDFERIPRPQSVDYAARREARKSARREARELRRKRRGAAAKISVREAGLYYIEASAVAEVLGLKTARVRRLISRGRLSLSNRGERVATTAAVGNTGLYFYGQEVGDDTLPEQDRHDHVFTHDNIYWLQRGPALPMAVVDGGRPNPVAHSHFREIVRAEGNKYSLTHLFDDPDDDYWMWDFRVGGLALSDCDAAAAGMPCYISEYPLPSPGVVSHGESDATLTLRLHGGSETTAMFDHHVTVTLNGETLGSTEWDGTRAHSARFTVPTSLLLDAGNIVRVDAAPSSDADMPSIVYINDISLEYPRASSARDQSLLIPGRISRTETVDGFRFDDMWVLDLANPKRPARVSNTTIDGLTNNYRVSFVAATPPGDYLVIDPRVARKPYSIVADEPSMLRTRRHRIDYLIITVDEMVGAAGVLAAYRTAQGLRAMVVNLEDIYDEFNHGIQNAEAIWRFLRYAHENWQQAPRYVLIAGEGSHDYKDYLGNGDAIVPTLLSTTPQGLFPSDNLYVDVEGEDRLPEMAVGRLPVMNSEEFLAVIEKIRAYETSISGEWERRALVVADAADEGGDYPADSERLAELFPDDYDVERIHLDSVDLASARSRIIDALNSGKAFMNFIGHGNSVAIGNRGLMTTADLESLNNGAWLPVITAQTCLAGQFGFPGVDGIGELLMLRPDRGAIAVWAPSGLSINEQARLLGEGFYASTVEGNERVIGDAIREAQRHYVENEGDEYLLDIYNLIGDPATIIK